MSGAFVPPAHFRDRPPRGRSLPRAGKMGKSIHNPEAEQTPKSPPVGGLFWNEWRSAGAFLAKKGFAPPHVAPPPARPVAVVVRRSLAPFSHSLLCGVSLRKKATLWPFHLLTPAPPKEILKEEIAVAGKKRSKRQKVHPLGGFFCFSPKMPIAAHPLREQVGMKNRRTSAREAYTIR